VQAVSLAIAIVLALALSIPEAIHQHKRAQEIEKALAIRSTVEYEISHWLGEHMPGQRVLAPGAIGFRMQAFSEMPIFEWRGTGSARVTGNFKPEQNPQHTDRLG